MTSQPNLDRSEPAKHISGPLQSASGGRHAHDRYPCVWPLPITPELAEDLYAIPPTVERQAVVERWTRVLEDARRFAPPPPEAIQVKTADVVKTLSDALAALDATGRADPSERGILAERLRRAEQNVADGRPVEFVQHRRPDRWAALAGPTDLDRIETQLEDARRALRQAEARDALLAGRPDGCWCFGTGGKTRRYVTDSEAEICGQSWFYNEYCSCPDGRAQQAHDSAARIKLLRHRVGMQLHAALGDADVPAKYRNHSFETFPVTDASRASFEAVREFWYALRDGRAKTRSLFIHGEPNVGKTALASCIFRSWVEYQLASTPTLDLSEIAKGKPIPEVIPPLFLKVARALDAIRATYNKQGMTADDLLNRVATAPFLVMDDLGTEVPTRWAAEKLFEIIDDRYTSGLPTIITTNMAPEDLELLLSGLTDGEMQLVEMEIAYKRNPKAFTRRPELSVSVRNAWTRGKRLVWRMIESCTVIEFEGDNLRDPDVRKRLGLEREDGEA